jgi:hypothetical protein
MFSIILLLLCALDFVLQPSQAMTAAVKKLSERALRLEIQLVHQREQQMAER